MAIDTAEKRRAAAGVNAYLFGPGVTPNFVKDAPWRAQVGYSYAYAAIVSQTSGIAPFIFPEWRPIPWPLSVPVVSGSAHLQAIGLLFCRGEVVVEGVARTLSATRYLKSNAEALASGKALLQIRAVVFAEGLSEWPYEAEELGMLKLGV